MLKEIDCHNPNQLPQYAAQQQLFKQCGDKLMDWHFIKVVLISGSVD